MGKDTSQNIWNSSACEWVSVCLCVYAMWKFSFLLSFADCICVRNGYFMLLCFVLLFFVAAVLLLLLLSLVFSFLLFEYSALHIEQKKAHHEHSRANGASTCVCVCRCWCRIMLTSFIDFTMISPQQKACKIAHAY